ncbi:MAG: hypothetical protein ACWA5W_07910 [Phycisphaerales bacterium]
MDRHRRSNPNSGNRPGNHSRRRDDHPDLRENAPGRIPESLINAAIDGELNDDIQREIANALQYDPVRRQEVLETKDAINALQMPIATPDFSSSILDRADRHRRFIPASWRRHVRAGRMGVAAVLLFSLMSVATLQRLYPRLSTLGSQSTPVFDVEQAVGHDTNAIATNIRSEVGKVRQSVASIIPADPTNPANPTNPRFPTASSSSSNRLFTRSANASLLSLPGRSNQRFEVSQVTLVSSSAPSAHTTSNAFDQLHTYPVNIGQQVAAIYLAQSRLHNQAPSDHADLLIHTPMGSSWTFLTKSSDSQAKSSTESTRVDIASLP